ncbi:hypothetical protein [Actinomadura rubrisoli]|uniref:Mce-associated membrane protein n=1 Tax=Actinomadura rubrisoli TaxID=2530368 RepID=A0A4R5BF02_9ACTN|nr:hypothetical protein [Actinomadura rubrisoli]TDD84205.1 hypothetical protein E1298_20320 [Actinomadura rubrisoli]
MTAKTTREAADAAEERATADEVEAVAADEEREAAPGESGDEPGARPARPAARRKRRVRVIEVIDDEDLDEVLEALDAEDEQEAAEPPARPARPARAAKPKPKAAPAKAAKTRPTRMEPLEEADDEAEDEDEAPAPRRTRTTASVSASDDTGDAPSRPMIFGLGAAQAIVVAVLVALLASLAIWQWTSASGLSSKRDERAEVSKVAAAYGDVAFNYNAANYQAQTGKAEKLMGGDLLESFRTTTLPNLISAFKTDPQVGVTSKTNQTFVGSVDGKFATAVVMVDVSFKTKDGAVSSPATLLRLALARIDGKWKVTKQYPSGVNDQNQNQQGSQLPVPGTSGSPAPTKSPKPKN